MIKNACDHNLQSLMIQTSTVNIPLSFNNLFALWIERKWQQTVCMVSLYLWYLWPVCTQKFVCSSYWHHLRFSNYLSLVFSIKIFLSAVHILTHISVPFVSCNHNKDQRSISEFRKLNNTVILQSRLILSPHFQHFLCLLVQLSLNMVQIASSNFEPWSI